MKELLQRKGLVLMFLAVILFNILPIMLNALVMSMRNAFLSNFDVGLISLVSSLICYGLFSIGLARYCENKNILKGLINGLPFLCFYLIRMAINGLVYPDGSESILWVDILLLIVYGILMSLCLLCSMSYNNDKDYKYTFKNILKILLVSVLVFIVPELLIGLIANIISANPFVLTVTTGLIYGLLVSIGLLISLLLVDEIFTGDNHKLKISKICVATGCFLLVMSLFVLNVKDNNKNNVLMVDNLIGYTLAEGDYAFDEGDVLAARDYYTNGKNYRCAYLYAIDNTADISGCEGELLDLFRTLNEEDALDQLKRKVNDNTANGYDIEALYKLLQEKKDKDLGKITKVLINDLRFKSETVLPSDLTDSEKEKLKSDLAKYEKDITIRKYIDIFVEWLNQGTMNYSVINTATKIASENPEVLGLQAEAIKFYIAAPENVYGDTRIVDKFVELTQETIKKQDKKDIEAYKTFVAYAYRKCNSGSSKVISFLEEFEPDVLTADMGDTLFVAYKKAGQHDKATEMAEKVLTMDEYNVEALTYLAIHKLQSDLDKSIDYTLKLAKVIEEKKDNYLGADVALGMWRYYLTGYYEAPDSNFCPYHNFWRDMTEEQQNKINNNEILHAYMMGQGLSEENFETFNKTVEKYDYVSYFRYYRAVYYVRFENTSKESKETWTKAKDDLIYATDTLKNKHPFMYSELGYVYAKLGDMVNSVKAYEIADKNIDDLGLGSTTYNYNNIHTYFSLYLSNAKGAMYNPISESEGDQ